jgi:hypothetical protein
MSTRNAGMGVAPKFYQTRQFYAGAAALVALGVVAAWRLE